MIDIAKIDDSLTTARPIQCKTCNALSTLDKKNADYLRKMLADPDKGGRHIAKVLTAAGYPIAASSVNLHRQTHE